MNNKKILSGLLLLSIVFSMFPPITITKANTLNHIPAFPEDLERAETDWVELDWYGSSILPEDKQQYQQDYESLIEEGKYKEAASLEMKKTLMYDQESYNFYKVPREVQDVVTQHMESQDNSGLQSIDQKDLLKDKIRQALASKNTSIQSISSSPLPQGRGVGGEGGFSEEGIYGFPTEDELPELQISDFVPLGNQNIVIDTQTQRVTKLTSTMIKDKSDNSQVSLQSTLPSVMDYYEGIENNPMDYALYSLIQQQNSDGSIGKTQKSRNTFAFLNMMKNIYRTNTGEFQKAQSYFVNLDPKNNLELVYKISVLADKSLDYSTLKAQLDTQMNQDNGIGLIQGYSSDFYTSLESAYLYGSLGDTQKYTELLNYLLPKIQNDGSIKYENTFNTGSKFLSYKMWKILQLGTFDEKQNYIDRLELFLATDQDSQNTFDTSLTSLYFEDKKDFDAVEIYQKYIEYDQENNGLFGDILSSIYATQAIAKADIVGLDITTTGLVQHYAPVDLTLSVKNIGYKPAYNLAFEKYVNTLQTGGNISANVAQLLPNSTVNINFTLENTIKYKGNTVFDFFVKSDNDNAGKNNWVSKEINFLNSVENKARFPDYYIAYSHQTEYGYGFNIRWNNDYIDNDLASYVIMFRKKGETTWLVYPASPDKRGYFIPSGNIGDTYEVTLGVKNIHNTDIQSHLTPTDVIISDNDTPVVSHISGNISIDGSTGESMKISGYGVSHTTDFDGSFSADFKQGKNIIMIDDDRYKSFKKYIHVGDNIDQYDFTLNTTLVADSQSPVVTNLKINNGFQVKNSREIPIDISVTDNIDVKDVDLYYFDPNYSAWIYIDSVDIHYGYGEYKWNIGDNLIGSGFQLKAIAHDWSGNISDPLKSNIFEIFDGKGLDAQIVLAKNIVKLGEDFSFHLESNNIGTFQNISDAEIVYNNVSKNIRSELKNLESSQQIFSIPYNSEFIGDNLYLVLSICDINQNCTEIQSENFNIIDADFSLNDAWEDKGELGFSLSNGDYNRSLYNISFSANNTIEIIYSDFYKYTGRTYQLIYRKYENGQWNQPLVLKNYPNSQSGDVYNMLLGVNVYTKNETTLIGYYEQKRDNSQDHNVLLDQVDVYAIKINNGVVSWEKQISNDDTFSYSLIFGVDNNNNIHVAWREGLSAVTGQGARILKTGSLDQNGNVGSVTALTLNGYGYDAKFFIFEDRLFIGYQGAESKYYLREFNSSHQTWGNEIFLFLDNDMKNYYLFKNNKENTYDIFFLKAQGTGNYGITYNISCTKFRIENNNVNVLKNTDITAPTLLNQIRNYKVIKDNNNSYHVIFRKDYLVDNTDRYELNYSVYKDDIIQNNYLLVSPSSKLEDHVYTSLVNNTIYVAYSTEISQTRTTKYLEYNFNSQNFGFPEFDIDISFSLKEFRITFLFLGYKFSFWINLFGAE